jgi:deaminated glutathione amidase
MLAVATIFMPPMRAAISTAGLLREAARMNADHPIAAAVQMRSSRSIAANIEEAVRLVRAAAELEAAYIQLPEMASLIERDRATLLAAIGPEERDPFLAAMREEARRAKAAIHIGSIAIRAGDKAANRGFLITAAGEIAARYDKIHLYDVDLPNGESWRESATFAAGNTASMVPTPIGLLGLAICYDIRFGHLFHTLAEAGAEILAAPAAFTKQTGEAHWHVLQRARAIENGAFMVSAAQGGRHEDGRETFGHSLIIDPWGRILAEAGTEPCIIAAPVDLALVADARARIPTLRHARRFAPPLASAEAAE